MSVTHKRIGPRRLRWTAEEYYRLTDLGFFQDRRVELIEGVIYQMPPQKNYHALGIKLCEDALNAAFGSNYWVRVQMSLDLSPHSVPDPDLAVIAGALRTHDPSRNPKSALLIVEVSDTNLRYDRRVKGSLYARTGIPEYWIVNLVKRQLEIRQHAVLDAHQRYGAKYTQLAIFAASDFVTPTAAPNARIPVADLLP